jgi:hypothetical protein
VEVFLVTANLGCTPGPCINLLRRACSSPPNILPTARTLCHTWSRDTHPNSNR